MQSADDSLALSNFSLTFLLSRAMSALLCSESLAPKLFKKAAFGFNQLEYTCQTFKGSSVRVIMVNSLNLPELRFCASFVMLLRLKLA